MNLPLSRLFHLLVLLTAVVLLAAVPSLAPGQKKKKAKAVTSATFEVYKDKKDMYRFRLKDQNGGLLANSGKGCAGQGGIAEGQR